MITTESKLSSSLSTPSYSKVLDNYMNQSSSLPSSSSFVGVCTKTIMAAPIIMANNNTTHDDERWIVLIVNNVSNCTVPIRVK
jgi:hypothetical protein